MSMIKKTVWITMDVKRWDRYSPHEPLELTAVKITNSKPTTATAGVVIELDMELDGDMFMPVAPKVTIVIEHETPAMTARVTGKRVRSTAAQKIKP